jgi:demethylmenaquinone methyltransferase/2-methoxy-6-polyprenyl-1,4-benzoquinol methylase
MFDAISGNYDSLNRVISFGIEHKVAKKSVRDCCKVKSGYYFDVAKRGGEPEI